MNGSSSAFPVGLMEELVGSMNNWYGSENWDADRFGAYRSSLKNTVLAKCSRVFPESVALVPTMPAGQRDFSRLHDSLEGLASFHDLLADEASRSILIKVMAY